VIGGESNCISAAKRRRRARSRFITPIAARSLQSVICVWKRLSRKERNLPSSRIQCSIASASAHFCGNSRTYMGRDSAISSYIFFLPSHVVSPTTNSAISKNGLFPSRW